MGQNPSTTGTPVTASEDPEQIREEIESTMRDYPSTARDAIDHFVEHELRDLRKAIRRQRRKLGL